VVGKGHDRFGIAGAEGPCPCDHRHGLQH
jgi:hypothetical protein